LLAEVEEGEFRGQEVIDTPGLLEPNQDDDQRHMAALFKAAERDGDEFIEQSWVCHLTEVVFQCHQGQHVPSMASPDEVTTMQYTGERLICK
jgi:hypothetical protein